MEQFFKELNGVLHEELNRYGQLLTTAQSMNIAIKTGTIDTVKNLTEMYDSIFVLIEALETKRLELCDAITAACKPECRHLNLQNIIQLSPSGMQPEFTTMRKELKEKIKALSALNTSNQILLSESLRIIGKNFELLAVSVNKLAGYKKSGAMDTGMPHKNLVNQIA
jgi:hypothetical protein